MFRKFGNFGLLLFGVVFLIWLGIQASKPVKPVVLHVNSITFKVYYSNTFPDDIQAIGQRTYAGAHIFGMTFCEDSKTKKDWIQIDPDQSLRDMQDTLWHEAKHAAAGCKELTAKTYDDLYDIQNPQELQLLRDNPELREYISITE